MINKSFMKAFAIIRTLNIHDYELGKNECLFKHVRSDSVP